METGFKANILLQLGILGQTELNIEMMEAALLRQIENEPKLQLKLELLEECNGVGIFTALGIILESGNIDRFHSVSHYLSYCGIGPSEGTSGYLDENSEQEKIVSQATPNPHSNRELKLLFVGATGSILRASKEQCDKTIQNNDMLRYSERYINDKRIKMKLKFKIAAKLARRVYYCLKHNLKYDPILEYSRSQIYSGIGENKVQKRLPKRKRQAWAYKKLSRMHVDVDVIMGRLQLWGDDDKRIALIRNDFKLFMRKYQIPDEFGDDSTGAEA
jgi:transposase IS116/IS110/IS902 family protein